MSVGPPWLALGACICWSDRWADMDADEERRVLPRVASMRSYRASESARGLGDELRLP